MTDLTQIWVYLRGTPLLGLLLTLLAYQAALMVSEWSGRSPLVNPVVLAVAAIALLLGPLGLSYPDYFEGAQFIHFLLGPATVGLAVPIAKSWPLLRGQLPALLGAALVGGLTSITTAWLLGRLVGLPDALQAPLLTKSITTPIAMGIVEPLGISPSLAAVYAIATGAIGAMLATPLFNRLGLTVWPVRGFSIGLCAHGIGTSRAFAVHPDAGAFASLAMGLHGVLGAILLPSLGTLILSQ